MKQIFFLLLIGIGIGIFVHANMFSLAKSLHIPLSQQTQSVQGISTTSLPKDFGFIQQQISKLSTTQIATASPQMQSIIHLLQKMPKTQLETVCQNVCSSIK